MAGKRKTQGARTRRRRSHHRAKQGAPVLVSRTGEPADVRIRASLRPLVPMLGGAIQVIQMHPRFRPGDPRGEVPLGGGRGRYRVTVALARPDQFSPHPDQYYMHPSVPGESHIAVAPPAVQLPAGKTGPDQLVISATTEHGTVEFIGHLNREGFLSRVETELHAENLADAEDRAHRLLVPTLSIWSLRADVPVSIGRTLVVDLANEAKSLSSRSPFRNGYFGLMSSPGENLDGDLRFFASLYRDALSSGSPWYEYLCYFKIAEGVRARRRRIAADHLAAGAETPRKESERVPTTEAEQRSWLDRLFFQPPDWTKADFETIFPPEAVGRKFYDLLDRDLNAIRVAVAHSLVDDGGGKEPLWPDEPTHARRMRKWLPLLKCVVRTMMCNDFPNSFLPRPIEPKQAEQRTTKEAGQPAGGDRSD